MDILSNSYKYSKVKNYYDDNNKLNKVLYKVTSPKTNTCYLINVEFHKYNLIFIKFYLKANCNSKHKYNLLSNKKEARPIIFTCLNIIKEYVQSYNQHSFGVIGARTKKKVKKEYVYAENAEKTKRFNVYKRLFINFVSEKNFEHFEIIEKSIYIVIRKSEMTKNPKLLDEITDYYKDYEINM